MCGDQHAPIRGNALDLCFCPSVQIAQLLAIRLGIGAKHLGALGVAFAQGLDNHIQGFRPQGHVKPDMRIVPAFGRFPQPVFGNIPRYRNHGLGTRHFFKNIFQLAFQKQAVVKDHICPRQKLQIALRGLVIMRVDARPHQGNHLCAIPRDMARQVPDHPGRTHHPFLALGNRGRVPPATRATQQNTRHSEQSIHNTLQKQNLAMPKYIKSQSQRKTKTPNPMD